MSKEKKEKITVELTIVDGKIQKVEGPKDAKFFQTVSSLDEFDKEIKEKIMESMKHGHMLLIGQNSPVWIIWQTATGYTIIWV